MGVCRDHKRDSRTASARFEVTMLSAFKEQYHGLSGPICWRIGDGASDEGFCGGKCDGSWGVWVSAASS